MHLLDQISRALPEAMWLTDLRRPATDITIDGRCTSLNSLSDFVSALEASKLFERPVEIVDSRVEAGDDRDARVDSVFGAGAAAREGGRLMALADPDITDRRMDLNLNKLPWYGQVGIFVVLGLALVGGFYWFYVVPARGRNGHARGRSSRRCASTSRKARRPRIS